MGGLYFPLSQSEDLGLSPKGARATPLVLDMDVQQICAYCDVLSMCVNAVENKTCQDVRGGGDEQDT